MNEKMYKASDVIGILLEEITNAEFLRVAKRLSDIPSAVVRCKDCKYSKEYSDKQLTCKWFDTLVFPNDFCSNGERRSE